MGRGTTPYDATTLRAWSAATRSAVEDALRLGEVVSRRALLASLDRLDVLIAGTEAVSADAIQNDEPSDAGVSRGGR